MKPRKTPAKPGFDAERVNPSDLGLVLSQLPHDHELVVAARLALEVRADRMPSGDDYPAGRYHRIHELPEHTALQKARYGLAGDRDQWVRYGPAGPPAIPLQRTADSVQRAREACHAAERQEPPAMAEEPPAVADARVR